MQPFANVLLQTIPGEKLVLASIKNLGCWTIKSSFSQVNALRIVTEQRGRTSAVTRNQSLLQYNFTRGVHCGSKSFTEMAPMVRGASTIIVIMGVYGAGKTTVGNHLAAAMNCVFLDADDFHPESNKEKMRKGIPLSEEDRIPWLQALCNALKECITAGNSAVLACSALRNTYREILRSSDPNYVAGSHTHSSLVKFVLLNVPVEVLSDRLNKRMENGVHFMPPTLLQSQLELLEIDASEEILQVDATQSPPAITRKIQDLLFPK